MIDFSEGGVSTKRAGVMSVAANDAMSEGPQLEVLVEAPLDARIIAACSSAAQQIDGPRLTQLGVCSSVRGEGRTSIAAGLAVVQGRDYGRATLLIDLDFDGPGLASLFGVPEAPGMADVLEGRVPVDRALFSVGNRVAVMPAGSGDSATPRLASLLDSARLRRIRGRFDVLVADLPPLLGSTSGALLASLFDPLLLVIRANVTPTATVREALASLESRPTPSVVLNGTRSSLPGWLQRLVAT